jgi:copper chaperone NosL
MKFFATVLVFFLCVACSVEPEPIKFGEDSCYTCKMTMMDNRFGAEIITKKGKVYKFDDLNCMINFHNSGNEAEENMQYRLVIDYAHPGKLIDTQHAFFVKSDAVRTPMASGMVAFESEEDYKKFKTETKGILLGWGEAVTQFK